MVQFNSKHSKPQIFSKGSNLNLPDTSKKNCQKHPKNLLDKQPKSTTSRLHATSFEEVNKKILLSLDTSKAAEIDQILATFLRAGAEVLALPLRNIMNLSIKLSTFPKECKIANLKHKLPTYFVFAASINIIGKSIHFQIEDYLNRRKLIYMYQSGFRRNHSTDSR